MPSWYLLLALLFIIANGFFVAAEFAIIKVRPTQLAEMAAEGSSRARMARRIIKKLDSYLSATQLGVTLASLALGAVGEPAFASLIQPRLAFFGVYSLAVAHTIAGPVEEYFADLDRQLTRYPLDAPGAEYRRRVGPPGYGRCICRHSRAICSR